MKIFLFSKDAMVIKIIQNSVKTLKLPLEVLESFSPLEDTSEILTFFDDSIPNITGIPDLSCPKVLLYKKTSKPLEGFNHCIKKPFLPTQILEIIRQYYKEEIPADEDTQESKGFNEGIDGIITDIDNQENLDLFEQNIQKQQAFDNDINKSFDEIFATTTSKDLVELTQEQDNPSVFTEEKLFDIPLDSSLDRLQQPQEEVQENEVIQETQEEKKDNLDEFFEAINFESNPFEEKVVQNNENNENNENSEVEILELDGLDTIAKKDLLDLQDKEELLEDLKLETEILPMQNWQDEKKDEDFLTHIDEFLEHEDEHQTSSPNSTSILNHDEIQEVKRLLEDTETTPVAREEINPILDDNLEGMSQDLSDEDFSDIIPKVSLEKTQTLQAVPSICDFLESRQKYLQELEEAPIYKNEMLEALEPLIDEENLKLSSDTLLTQESIPLDGKEFIHFIKSTPQEKLEQILHKAQISLKINFKED